MQAVTGPALILPYTVRFVETSPAVRRRNGSRRVMGSSSSEVAASEGNPIDVETRSRGIFDVPVYRLTLTLDGEFGQPNLQELASI